MAPDAPLMESTGIMTREWIFGGRFLKETVQAEMGGEPFEGTGFIGFNNLDGQYEFVWLNSVSTNITLETGSYNPDTKIMTFRGSHRDPATGRTIPARGTLDMTNPNRHVFTGYMVDANGKEFKSGEGIATRKQ